MSSAFHFYLVFNPFMDNKNPDNTQAHDFYNLLKARVSKNPKDSLFWGKLKSSTRKEELEFEKFKKALEFNQKNGSITHLYVSDFEHLWVGKVESVSNNHPGDERTLPFYSGKEAEIWFEISDFDLLDNTHVETALTLRNLYIEENEFMISEVGVIKGVNPYLSKLRYPLIVQDHEFEEYFENLGTEIQPHSHLVLKTNPIIVSKGAGRVTDALVSYCFPKKVFDYLPHGAKEALISAELNILDFQNFRGTAFSYLKSLEITFNHLVINKIKVMKMEKEFFVNADKMLLGFNKNEHYDTALKDYHRSFSINSMINFFKRGSERNETIFAKAFRDKKEFCEYVTGEFSRELQKNQLVDLRNLLAHDDETKVSHEDAMRIRKIILGVGCIGLINKLYRAYNPKGYQELVEVQGNYKDLKKAA